MERLPEITRPAGTFEWVREHRRLYLRDGGAQGHLVDITVTGGFTLGTHATQADWLRGLGLDDLVAEARAAWDASAHVADLAALRHRSRVSEGSALTDPAGLGAHHVLEFVT